MSYLKCSVDYGCQLVKRKRNIQSPTPNSNVETAQGVSRDHGADVEDHGADVEGGNGMEQDGAGGGDGGVAAYLVRISRSS